MLIISAINTFGINILLSNKNGRDKIFGLAAKMSIKIPCDLYWRLASVLSPTPDSRLLPRPTLRAVAMDEGLRA